MTSHGFDHHHDFVPRCRWLADRRRSSSVQAEFTESAVTSDPFRCDGSRDAHLSGDMREGSSPTTLDDSATPRVRDASLLGCVVRPMRLRGLTQQEPRRSRPRTFCHCHVMARKPPAPGQAQPSRPPSPTYAQQKTYPRRGLLAGRGVSPDPQRIAPLPAEQRPPPAQKWQSATTARRDSWTAPSRLK